MKTQKFGISPNRRDAVTKHKTSSHGTRALIKPWTSKRGMLAEKEKEAQAKAKAQR